MPNFHCDGESGTCANCDNIGDGPHYVGYYCQKCVRKKKLKTNIHQNTSMPHIYEFERMN